MHTTTRTEPDDNIVGSVNDSKQLIRTVEESAYTDENDEQAYRINVSVICPNGTAKENSYVRKLVDASKGIFYSDSTSEVQVMTLNATVNNNDRKTTKADTIKKNVIEICGYGNGTKFKVILSTGLVGDINLKARLCEGSLIDSDEDGLSDWDEVNIELVPKYAEMNSQRLEKKNGKYIIKTNNLPTIAQILSSDNWKAYTENVPDKLMRYATAAGVIDKDDWRILPINSDPTKADSDDDGFFDGITGKYQPTGYYKVADKWPLSSKPHPAFYQKDGEYYFNKFDFPKTYVGGRPGGYALHTLNLDKEEQKYIYTLCSIVNNDDNFSGEISPLLIMAICAHETGCQCIYNTGTTDVMGYMQTNYKYIDAYCKDGQYDDVWLENIRFEVSKWTNVNQNDFNILAEKMDKPCIDKLLKDNPFVNIMFGMAFLYQHCIDQTDMWSGLKHYCWIGDNYSPLEDTYYTEILVELIDEEMPYEKGEEYNENEEIPVYQVFINGVPVPLKLSK